MLDDPIPPVAKIVASYEGAIPDLFPSIVNHAAIVPPADTWQYDNPACEPAR
jgi:hypothetical protein